MSADNGIYILVTNTEEGDFVYRVAHLQAIENVYYDKFTHSETENPDIWIENAREMWANSPVYESKAEALLAAAELLEDQLHLVEYGISFIGIQRVF